MNKEEKAIVELKLAATKNKNLVKEIDKLFVASENSKSKSEKDSATSQIIKLQKKFQDENRNISDIVGEINLPKPLNSDKRGIAGLKTNEKKKSLPMDKDTRKYIHDMNSTELEKGTLKRIKWRGENKEKKIQEEKITLENPYSTFANSLFSGFSKKLSEKNNLKNLERELIKAHLPYTPTGYFSTILLTTLIVLIGSLLVAIFFLFFYLGIELPIIHLVTTSIIERIPMVIWMIFVFPLGTFLFMYSYPSLEKKSAESAIDQELPFATIHMAAISGSMIDPSKIFSIMISTKEYPHIEKELVKLMNEINIYGYDLVSALRNIAFNSPSKKLAELFNGLATTINSGGNLPDFFNKRAETLLFEYKLEKEKSNKAAETFMDIYISVVIAAPMILMLLLMMMKISGLGLSLSTSLITLIMVLSVAVVNVVFIVFLHLKK